MITRRATNSLVAIPLLAVLASCGSQNASEEASDTTFSEAANPQPMADGPAHPAQVAFIQCASCHAATPGAPPKVGPNLYGVVGRAAGVDENYAYSDALMESGLVWDRATLDAFIASPNSAMPGTKMVYIGLQDAEQRALIIDYLESLQQ